MVLSYQQVIHILTNKKQTNVRKKSFKLDKQYAILISRDFEQVFLQEVHV